MLHTEMDGYDDEQEPTHQLTGLRKNIVQKKEK